MTRIARWLTRSLTALLLLIGTMGVASAAEHGPTAPTPPPTPTTPATHYAELEQQYQLQQQQLHGLLDLFTRDGKRTTEIATLITRAKAAGKNTAALEQALVLYRAQYSAARTALYSAADILKTHTGFSSAGKVTNPDQARATVKAAGSALTQSYLTLHSADELLTKAVAAFRNQG